MTRPLQRRLVIVGHLGSDVYVADDQSVFLRPSGAAYCAACGVQATGGDALVITSSSQWFNRTALSRFEGSGVRIVDRRTGPGREHLSVFDLRAATPAENQQVISLGEPVAPPVEVLADTALQDLHVHFSTMKTKDLLRIWQEVRALVPKASLSCSLCAKHPSPTLDDLMPLIRTCSVVVVDGPQFEMAKTSRYFEELLRAKIVAVTCGDRGAACFVDGCLVFAHSPHRARAVSDIGASDVFAGALLAGILRTRELSGAAALAAEIAASSVGDFGVERVPRNRPVFEWPRTGASAPWPRIQVADPHAFSWNADPHAGRLVEATGVFAMRGERLLVVRKPDDRALRPGKLYVPGGKLMDGELPVDCARRELMEETGLIANDLVFLGVMLLHHHESGRCFRFFQYLANDPEGQTIPNDDVCDCLWVKLADIDGADLFHLTRAQLSLSWLVSLWPSEVRHVFKDNHVKEAAAIPLTIRISRE